MKTLLAAIRRAPKRTAAVTMLAAAVVVPAALFAWGPDRPTYDYSNPAPHVTFNSMTGTPNYGDERNFVTIKEAGAPNSAYTDNVDFAAGKEYTVMVYFHNNARTSLNSAENNYAGIARNTQMRVQMPANVSAGQKARITGFVSADNAQPQSVWDEAYGSASGNFALRYVPDSATIYSNGAVNGQKLPETLYTTGAKLGYDSLDGNLPGCNQYAGYVTFNVKVDQPNFTVEKQVSKDGANTYGESVTVNPGDKVQYKIQYKNTGTTQQNDVVISDKLPAGVSYVPGSTMISNATTNSQWSAVTNDGVTARGINIGSYAPGGNAYVKFTAKVADNTQLPTCGANTLINTATAETKNGNKSDTANVVVTKTCVEQPKDILVCDLASKKIVTIKENTFDASKHSKNLDDCKPTTPGKINVCDMTTKKIVTIDQAAFDASKHSKTLEDCVAKPTTPAELPQTGPAQTILSVFGLGSLIAASAYYVASRRALN